MSDDYLWNRSGTPDPEIERLEQLLAPARYRPRPLRLPEAGGSGQDAPAAWRRYVAPLALAAAIALLVGGAWAVRPGLVDRRLADAPAAGQRAPAQGGWTVAAVRGTPTLGAAPLRGAATVEEAFIETDSVSAASLASSDVGHVDIGPGSRVRVLRAGEGARRLALDRGRLEAFIWAAPGRFLVETPAAVAVDLGCAYSLEVDATGTGRLRVTAGWVGLERQGRESFVPDGAVCSMRAGRGPGTPHFEDATPAFVRALDAVDSHLPDTDGPAVDALLREARDRDAFSLWHLLTRLDRASATRVHDRLASLVPPPRGVTRERVLNGDRAALDAWWNTFGLGEVTFFRVWMERLE